MRLVTASDWSGERCACRRHRWGTGEGQRSAAVLRDDGASGDIKLIGDPETNLKLIVKDGRIYKHTLAA